MNSGAGPRGRTEMAVNPQGLNLLRLPFRQTRTETWWGRRDLNPEAEATASQTAAFTISPRPHGVSGETRTPKATGSEPARCAISNEATLTNLKPNS